MPILPTLLPILPGKLLQTKLKNLTIFKAAITRVELPCLFLGIKVKSKRIAYNI